MGITDQELIKNFQSGDHEAFAMLFERYKGPILNFCLRFLGNRAEAEDTVSDVFLSIVSDKYTFTAEAKFSTWIYTVARNNCLSKLRKKPNVSIENLAIESDSDNSRDLLEQKITAGKIKTALNKLPLEQKEAIILREYQQLPYNEIAQILNCSLEKVKVLIFRAREALKVELSSFLKEDY